MNPAQLKWSSLKVGIVVLIGLVVFVFIVSIVGTEQNIFASTHTLKLFMPNARGLVNGAMVSLGGLKVGFVTDMQFAQQGGINGVDISMKVLTKHRSSITTSSLAQIKTIGLLGDKYIDLSIGSPGEEPLAENAYLPLRESFDLEEAGPQLKNSLTEFTDLLGSARRIASTIEKGEGSAGKFLTQPTVANETERFLRSLNSMMAALEQKSGALGRFMYDDSLARNIAEVSANLRSVTGQLREGKGTMGKLIMDNELYTNLASFSSRADSLLAKASGDSSNVSKLLTDGSFYTQLLGLMRDLNLLLVDLREHPDRYVKVSVF